MKETLHSSDGSQYYGNGVWGPSRADLQRADLFFSEESKTRKEPSSNLLFVSQESIFGKLLQAMSKTRLPARFAIPVGLAVAVVAIACGSKNSEESKLPSTPRPSESGAPPNPENPFAILQMPFPKDTKMEIQQGWFYTGITGKKEHKGIDFIKGGVDNSTTWRPFPVLAAADGFACANPPSREGNAVLLTHRIGDTPIGSTYYGHLDAIENDIPACDDKGKTPKLEKQGAKLGDAGATGVKDNRGIEQPTWKHLHFQVNDAKGNPIDPYDLQKERDIYPDPNFSNGKPCGQNALFIDCYPKGAVVAGPKSPIPPISGKVTERKVEVPTPTPTLAKLEILKEEWHTFKSSLLPYEVQYPSSWNTESWKLSGQSTDSFNDGQDQKLDKDRFSLSVSDAPINPKITLDDYVNNIYIQSYRQNWKEFNPDQPDLINFISVKKRKIAGLNSQIIQINKPPTPEYRGGSGVPYRVADSGDLFTSTLFIEPRANDSQRLWIIIYNYPQTVSKADGESILNRFLDSFKLLPSASVEKQESKTEVGWTRFKSFDLPYQIDYPSNWQQLENNFFGETTKANPTQFTVGSETVASWITIDDYKNRFVQSVKDFAKFVGGNAQITETPNQSIDGQKAWRINGAASAPSVTPYRSVTYITIKDGIAWALTYAADSSEFNQNFPTFEKMLKSFKFLK